MGDYTTSFEEESLYSRKNLGKLKNDFTKLGEIDGGEQKTFKDWALQIDRRSGIFDLKIDNKDMEEDDFDKDINTVIAKQDKVAEKRRLFFLELYKPLNNPTDFKDNKIDSNLKEELNEPKSKQNWKNFSKSDEVLNYRELLSKTAEKERKTLCKFLKKSKKSSSRGRERDDEEYTPNDKQNELNFFADVSNKFAPEDPTPILKKSDYITFEFLEELKDICSGKKDDKKDDMKNVKKEYHGSDLNDDIFSLDDDQLGLNAEFNEKQKEESDKKLKYYFPNLHTFLSVNLEDLINITDQYKIQISKLGGDKKVKEEEKKDDDYYRDKPETKSSVNDLKLQLERINVAALNFIIAFATSDLKNTYVENYSNISVLLKMKEMKEMPPKDKDIDRSGSKACVFLSTLISNAKDQLKIHDKKMALLEENKDVNLMHAKEKHDFIPSIVDECFPKGQSPEIEDLKEEFYGDPKEILNRISNDKKSDNIEENENPLKKFLYDESGLKFIVNMNSQFNKKLEEKNKLNNKRIEDLKKSIKKETKELSDKKNQKNEAKNREIDKLANIRDYKSYEISELKKHSESYKEIFDNIINHLKKKVDLCCNNAVKKIKELIDIIDIIRDNYKNNPTFVKGIVNKLRKLKYEIGKELGEQNKKYKPIYTKKVDSIKTKLGEIGFESDWNEKNEEILDNLFKKEKDIQEKIKEIDKEINGSEVENAMKSVEEIKNEITNYENAMKSAEEVKDEITNDGNRLQYLNNLQENNYNPSYSYYNGTTGQFSNRNNFHNFYKNNYRKNNYYGRNYKRNGIAKNE